MRPETHSAARSENLPPALGEANIALTSMSKQEQKVLDYYGGYTAGSYIQGWDPDHLHLGRFLEGETVSDFGGEDQAIHKRSVRRMTEFVTEPAQIRPIDIVVDAGCGIGGTAIYLSSRYGCRVVGVNLSRHQIGIAEKKVEEVGLSGKVSFLEGNCSQRLPMDAKSVDVIVNIESACHYSNRDKFVSECARILRDNGQIVGQDWIARDAIDQSKLIAPMCDAWRLQFPLETPSSYSVLLERHGFEVIDLIDIDGLKPTIDLFKSLSYGIMKKAMASCEFTDRERDWLRQFETITSAYRAGHFTLLRYHARLSPRAAA